jgi:hypothetical protein
MHVLRHDNVPGNHKQIAQANPFQGIFKKLHRRHCGSIGTTLKTTEGEEVKLPGLLIPDALAFHVDRNDMPIRSGLK